MIRELLWMQRARYRASNAAAFVLPKAPSFDPATLALSGWWRDYAGAPWAGTPSAGTSGSHALVSVGSDPSVGTLNGHGIAVFDGISQSLVTADSVVDLIDANAVEIVVVFRAASGAPHVLWYNDAGLVATTTNQTCGVAYSTDAGVAFGTYDSATFAELDIGASLSNWHCAQETGNGSTLRGRLDSADYSSIAKGPTVVVADTFNVGKSSTGAAFFSGSIAEIMTAKTLLSDGDRDNIKSYVNSRYGLSL